MAPQPHFIRSLVEPGFSCRFTDRLLPAEFQIFLNRGSEAPEGGGNTVVSDLTGEKVNSRRAAGESQHQAII